MMEEKDYTLIDQYLQDELTENQAAAFKDRLARDEEFSVTFKLSQQMRSYLQASSKQPALEQQMASLGKQYFETEKTTKAKVVTMPFLRIGLSIAAAITLLFVVWNPFSSGDLYGDFASHPPLALVEKSAASDVVQQVEKAYANGQYEEAFSALTALIEQEPENVQAQLALGISALEIGKITKAQAVFNDLANGSSVLKSYGQWYLALSFIKQDQNYKAKPILEAMSNEEPALKKKAIELLGRLK